MKNPTLSMIAGGVIALAVLSLGLSAGHAAPLPVNNYFHGFAEDASETFATTSYADVTGATVSVPASTASVAYAETNAPGTPTRYVRLKITWAATGSKATSTDGTCAVYVNGAVLATTARVVPTAAASTMAGVVLVARTSDAAQTVKLQCKSGDTAVFTVTNSALLVEEVVR